MKKIYLLLSFIAVFLVSCDDDNNSSVSTPEVKAAVENLTVPAEGGTQTLSYSISNPVEGGQIEAVPTED